MRKRGGRYLAGRMRVGVACAKVGSSYCLILANDWPTSKEDFRKYSGRTPRRRTSRFSLVDACGLIR